MQFKLNGVGYNLQAESKDNNRVTYTLMKILIQNADLDLSKATRKFNKLYPDDATTSQNLSNKLYRDSLRVTEFFKLLNALGYVVSFDFAEKETFKPVLSESKDETKLSALLKEGFTDCKSKNYTGIVITGAKAQEAAEFIESNLTDGMTETQELYLLISANHRFGVDCKPVI